MGETGIQGREGDPGDVGDQGTPGLPGEEGSPGPKGDLVGAAFLTGFAFLIESSSNCGDDPSRKSQICLFNNGVKVAERLCRRT